ncbi:glutamate receptor 2.3-like [Juglans microcarpa x Juglans regia]|uniref:glutamate receptor 2.3-like n=1 Tax=Juglans microcarpa x Juglans regia TaxID=2249226 RepID=UPI001B7E78AB|nr:glutamate receptor 2.3-like [Juglans microcarpa x Juglans regia]
MASQKHLAASFILFFLLNSCVKQCIAAVIPVGVVLDLNSTVGELAESCIFMALSDFYAVNAHYRTRLALFTRDSRGDVVGAACAALDLMKNEEVHAIIGPQRSSQAKFVVDIAEKVKVPILSFSATSPSLSPNRSPFFIRTAQNDSAQVKAIMALIQAYGWQEVIPIYEDTDYGNGLIPYVTDAFHEVDVRVPYRSVISPLSKDIDILEELKKLKEMQTRIFLVHMTASLGSKFFVGVKNAGMMSEGYAWIITEGLSGLFDPLDLEIMDSMQGVLGVRSYVSMSKDLEDFERRRTSNFTSGKPTYKTIPGLNLFGLWAYDTVWALAMAVEKAGIERSSFLKQNNASKCKVDLAALGISEMGPRLLNAILTTRFQGLSGDFHLVKGQLEASAFEIFNIIGKTERIIGYWTPKKGLSRELDDTHHGEVAYSISKDKLKQPIWPGDTTDQPKRLRIGVPIRDGFNQFVKVEWHPHTGKPKISGFSIELFLAVMDLLPFCLGHEFVPYVNENGRTSAGTYDDLLYQLKLKKFDAVVGDVTIVANRSLYVDFTLPYSESGVSMAVLMKNNEKENIWIFLKPLSWDLWLIIVAVSIFTGLVIWVLEHRINPDFSGSPKKTICLIFWFSLSTLIYGHRERVMNSWSRLVLIIWLFVVLILTQSYTASLASMLTVQQLKPAFVDVTEIKRNGYFVGYHKDSFVRGLLVKQLNIDESKLKPYSTPEQYHEALSSGSQNGGVAAIFDEIPYIKIFLAKYGSKYTMAGPVYKTDGFGFAFPIGSPLVSYMSRAILNVTEDKEKMKGIRRKYLAPQKPCEDLGPEIIPSNSPSLGVYSFGGLFIITGVASLSSLLIYVFRCLRLHWPASNNLPSEGSFWLRFVEFVKHFDLEYQCSPPLSTNGSTPNPAMSPEGLGASHRIDDVHNHSRTFNETADNVSVVEDDDDEIFPLGHGDTSVDVSNNLL